MASLGTLGLNRQYTVLRIKFSGSGIVFKIIPWGINQNLTLSDDFADYPFVKSVPMVSLSLGSEFVNFVPYDSEDITSIVRNPIRLLQSAVINRRNNRIDKISLAWENVFPAYGKSVAGSPINLSVRYLLPAIVFSEDSMQYQTPRGLGHTKVLLSVSKTVVGGVVGCIMRDGIKILGPNNIVMSAVPKQSKYTLGEGVSAKQYVVNTMEYQISPDILKAIENLFNSDVSNTWDSVISPISPEEQLELLFASTVPKSAVVYALKHTEWANMIPENYMKAGLEELEALDSSQDIYMDRQNPTMYNQGFTPQIRHDMYQQPQYPYIPQRVPQAPYMPQQAPQPPQAPYAPQQAPQPPQGPYVPQQVSQLQQSAQADQSLHTPQQTPLQQTQPSHMNAFYNRVQGNFESNYGSGVPENVPGIPRILGMQQELPPQVQQQGQEQAVQQPQVQNQAAPQLEEDSGQIPLPTNVKDILDSLKNRLS